MLKGKGYDLVCSRCGKALKVGDEIHARIGRRKRGASGRFYHKKCWDAMFIEVS